MGGVIERDPRAAADARHDLIVVGGGVYGCALALGAARRGLRPLLLERDDFGQHTSWSSLRIVHGGLRSLQQLDLRRFFESVAERRWWLRCFPDLVRPLPCVMPLYGRGLHRRSVLRPALAANDLLSWRRNAGIARQENRLPAGRLLSASETAELLPGVERAELTGGALWYDAAMPDSHRVLIELLRWACACGATSLNYVEAVELRVDAGRVVGVLATDRLSGETLELAAPVVVNCCGPWSREMAGRFDRDVEGLFRPSLAFNLLLDRAPDFSVAAAVVPRRPGAGAYFLVPWKGRILAGTYHAPWAEGLEHAEGRAEHVERFRGELEEAAPGLAGEATPVLRVLWGRLPVAREGTDRLATRESIYDHGAQGGPDGLFSVSGVKFTMARRVAERTLRALRSRTAGVPAPTSPAVQRPPPRTALPLEELRDLRAADSTSAHRVVRRLVAEESVVQISDLLIRRTDWGMIPGRVEALLPWLSEIVPPRAPGRRETARHPAGGV